MYGPKCYKNIENIVKLAKEYFKDGQIKEAKNQAKIVLEKYGNIPNILLFRAYCLLIKCHS